jgi:hypothetical protein
MWENIIERGRAQMAIWRVSVAGWVSKTANTHSEYVLHIVFPLRQWLQEGAPIRTLPVLFKLLKDGRSPKTEIASARNISSSEPYSVES